MVQKWPFFQLLFLGNICQENVFYDILQRKNAFLGYKKKNSKNSKNWHFFKGVNPWFWSKNGHFSNFYFLGNVGRNNVFYDILERKNAFGPKMAIFPTFIFWGNKCQENVIYDILERKNSFLAYKNKKFKKSKNWHFSKVVNQWFWSKNGHFSNFYFLGNISQENVFCDILEQKNAFLGYKNNKFKKSKNWHFSKGVNPWFLFKNGHFSNFFF